jgi:spore maturation protein CgeB
MKLLRINTNNGEYLKQFYRRRPYLEQQSYAEQRKALAYDAFFWDGYWTVEFSKLGYEVQEIIWNCKTLQRQWAIEHLPLSKHSIYNLDDILLSQITTYNPDIVWLKRRDIEFLKTLKARFPGIKLIIGWVGSELPREHLRFFLAPDIIFSCAPESVEQLSAYRENVYHINHWFVPDVLTRINSRRDSHDVVFTGEIRLGPQHHRQRLGILEALVKQCKFAIYSSSVVNGTTRLSVMQNLCYIIRRNPYRHIMNVCREGVFGLDMIQLLRDSLISLNMHADSSPRFASNMKMFEVCGSGSCLVTDWKENINDLFAEDTEVVTYKSVGECVEKVKWLLANPKKRQEIARAAQKRVETEHRFDQRAEQIHDVIVSVLKRREASYATCHNKVRNS